MSGGKESAPIAYDSPTMPESELISFDYRKYRCVHHGDISYMVIEFSMQDMRNGGYVQIGPHCAKCVAEFFAAQFDVLTPVAPDMPKPE